MKLYKYMSPEVAEHFIKRPLLRITPAFCLNDPFEINLSKSDIDNMKQHINMGAELNFESDLYDFMASHGIISLSKSNNNLLMWSHYAKDHKGLVVELNVVEDDEFSIFNVSGIPTASDAFFSKVFYEEKRAFSKKFDSSMFNELKNHYYTTKYKDWGYEGEYRFIFPFTSANILRLDTENSEYDSVRSILKLEIEENTNQYRELSIERLSLYWIDVGYKLVEFNEALFSVWANSHVNSAMFFVQLSPNAVENIFVGAKADSRAYDKWFKLSENNRIGRHYYSSVFNDYLGVMQAELNLNAFSIEFPSFSMRDKS